MNQYNVYWNAAQLKELTDVWEASDHGAKAVFIEQDFGPFMRRRVHAWVRFVSPPVITVEGPGRYVVEYALERAAPPA